MPLLPELKAAQAGGAFVECNANDFPEHEECGWLRDGVKSEFQPHKHWGFSQNLRFPHIQARPRMSPTMVTGGDREVR